jgi:hypothetical protein
MEPIPPKWLGLAGDLLELAADKFSNHGCNDYEFPKDWTVAERRRMLRAMHDWNGDPGEYDPDEAVTMDWFVMAFLADRLKEAAKAAS